MRRFTRDELQAFLKSVDKYATKNSKLVLIGGAAATLSFGSAGGTVDIDTANNVSSLERACEAARIETGLPIPLGYASVFDAPYEYESRLNRLALRGMRKLTVLVPEKHDWALMKVVRFEDKDLEQIKTASKSVGLDLTVFEERFLTEMTHIEPRTRLMIHFLAMIEELYGDDEASRMEQAIKRHKFWQ
jgi:hypothetical protein